MHRAHFLFIYFFLYYLTLLLLSIKNLCYADKTVIFFISRHHPEPKRQFLRGPDSCLGKQQAIEKLKSNYV